MNNVGKYVLGFAVLVFVVWFCWYFSSIIAYVLVAAFISFLGKPIIDLLGGIRIRGYVLPSWLKATLTVVALWLIFILFFVSIIPLVVREFQNLENISIENVMGKLEIPLYDLGLRLKNYGILEHAEELRHTFSESISSLINVSKVRDIFGSMAHTVGGILVALFSITFITFFFLKDSRLFSGMVLVLLPARYEESGRKALGSIQKLLVRYFVGITIEMMGVMTLNTLGLWALGFSFANAIVIGLVSGILNVIPYIGPIIGIVFGVLVGIVLNIDIPFYTDMLPLLLYMLSVMLFTQLIDNVVFQPLIYGNSVHAHPLEIFLVLLMAGSVAGIPGMILAIPAYTVLRVILKEFFSKYKLVKKITHSLEEKQEQRARE